MDRLIFGLQITCKLLQLEYHLLAITTNKTRLKLRILDHFSGQCQEQSDGKNVMIIFNEGMKRILKDALPFHDYESDALAMAKAVKILRREVLSWKSLPFNG